MNNSGEKRLLVKRNHGKRGMYYLTPLSPRDLSEISEESFDLPFLDPSRSTLCNSCGGLLFFINCPFPAGGSLCAGHGYLCNPTTKQVQIIPSKEAFPSPNYVDTLIGGCVGYDSKSDDYKILGIWQRDHRRSEPPIRTFALYSLRTHSWNEIPNLYEDSLKWTCGIEKSIYVRGKCYWLCLTESRVISFDYSNESFSYLPLPRKAHIFRFRLVKFNDEDLLGMVYCGRRGGSYELEWSLPLGSELGHYFEAWVWREGWDNRFCVSLGGAVDQVEGTIYDGFLFLRGPSVDVEQQRLVVYDSTKKECKELGIYNYHNIIDVFCYVESPVWMPYGMPISEFLEFPIHLVKDKRDYEDEEDECQGIYGSPYEYDSMEEHDYEDECDSVCEYNSLAEARDADLDDFAANGFRVLDHIELEEEAQEMRYNAIDGWMAESRYNAVMKVVKLEPQEAEVVHCPLLPFIPGATQHYYALPSYENPDTTNPDEYNRVDFHVINYEDPKFFVIKSDSEDDVHKSIMYNMWSCSPYGNKKLNDAYKDAQRIAAGFPGDCPIFLFFFVNMSGLFCGMAEMSGPVDFHRDMDLDNKRSGSFPVKWHLIKDLSGLDIFHTLWQNNTDNRDIQRISYSKGSSMLAIFNGRTSKTSLLDKLSPMRR